MSGPMAAAYLARMLPSSRFEITYIKPPSLKLAELYASTSPAIRDLNRLLKIPEAQFIRTAHGTLKLGQQFENWGQDSYVRPYAEYGLLIEGNAFHQICCRDESGGSLKALEDYCLPVAAGRAGKFMPPADASKPILSDFNYGYHIDPTRYADILTQAAQTFGATIIENQAHVTVSPDGRARVKLSGAATIEPDLLINSTGELLPEHDFESWAAHLPCDHIQIQRKASADSLGSFTVNTAHEDHWVQTSSLQDADIQLSFNAKAISKLPDGAQPFAQGRAQTFWSHSVLNLGLAAARFVPLDGNGLHMIQMDLERLVELCPPDMSAPMEKAEYNRRTVESYDRLRDFLAIHYNTCKAPGAFGDMARSAALPEPAEYKLKLFHARGRIAVYDEEGFLRDSWIPMLLGQDIWPKRYDRLADQVPASVIAEHKLKLKTFIANVVKQMPSQSEFITRSCAIDGFKRDSITS